MQSTLRRMFGAVTVAAVALTLLTYYTKECLGEDALFEDDFNNANTASNTGQHSTSRDRCGSL